MRRSTPNSEFQLYPQGLRRKRAMWAQK